MSSAARVTTCRLGPGPEPHQVLPGLHGREGAFLLESALRPGRRSRWSYLGFAPFAQLLARKRRAWLKTGAGRQALAGGAFAALRATLERWRVPRPPEADGDSPEFLAGAVGFLGYELGALVERLPAPPPAGLGLPDMHLGLYDLVLAYDHQRETWQASAAEFSARSAAVRALRVADKLAAAAKLVGATENCARPPEPEPEAADLRADFSRRDYEAAVGRVLEYIAAGDVYQVNLSQRLSADWPHGAGALYERLRRVNPAPFAAFYDFGDGQVVSASPELFLHVAGRRAETRPIKGTARRGDSPAEDRELARALEACPKNRAELTMIVDLERNDLGRVCSYGSVRVEPQLALESYPTVHHLVSTVTGELHDGRGAVDLLTATFPGGSVTGAPKIRAMEIISELERSARGVYCGALGFLGFDGTMELNLPIRTFTVAGGRAHFGVGGAVVADSSPAGEYEETRHKARGLLAALQPHLAEVGT